MTCPYICTIWDIFPVWGSSVLWHDLLAVPVVGSALASHSDTCNVGPAKHACCTVSRVVGQGRKVTHREFWHESESLSVSSHVEEPPIGT